MTKVEQPPGTVKVYRGNYNGPDGHYVLWAGSEAACRRALRDAIKDGNDKIRDELPEDEEDDDREDFSDPQVEVVFVPIRKAALIEWLNANLSMDNG